MVQPVLSLVQIVLAEAILFETSHQNVGYTAFNKIDILFYYGVDVVLSLVLVELHVVPMYK